MRLASWIRRGHAPAARPAARPRPPAALAVEALEGRCLPSAFTTFSAGITPAGVPVGIVTGPDGNLWFTEFNGNMIGKITPAGAVTEYPLPAPNRHPTGITAGPDGNLWFLEAAANATNVGRISPATGTIKEFPIPTVNSKPLNICVGPDGDLWFTELGKIAHCTLAGAITEFPAPNTLGNDIAAGPDGKLWFTDEFNTISQLTPPNGTVTSIPLPMPGRQPYGITFGPDGNFWFAEKAQNSIGRMSTGGNLTEFVLPTPQSLPRDITVGPDGNLWFLEAATGKLGRITPAGAVSEFALPGAVNPFGITAGPDGNLWYGLNDSAIGRFTLVSASTAAPSLGVGQAFFGTVAAFTVAGGGHAADYTATINWGDGSPPAAGFISGAGILTITGAHTYTHGGSFSATVSAKNVNAPLGVTPAGFSAGFTVTVNPATHLVFVQQPADVKPGRPFVVRVAVEDAANHVVAADTSAVTLALAAGPAAAALAGTTTVAAVNGVATFTGLSLNIPGAGYVFSATDGTLTGATSAPVAVDAPLPPVTRLTFVAPVHQARHGHALPALRVQLLGAGGKPVALAGVQVTLVLPHGKLLGGAKHLTDAHGVARFTGLKVAKAGKYVLKATAPALHRTVQVRLRVV